MVLVPACPLVQQGEGEVWWEWAGQALRKWVQSMGNQPTQGSGSLMEQVLASDGTGVFHQSWEPGYGNKGKRGVWGRLVRH